MVCDPRDSKSLTASQTASPSIKPLFSAVTFIADHHPKGKIYQIHELFCRFNCLITAIACRGRMDEAHASPREQPRSAIGRPQVPGFDVSTSDSLLSQILNVLNRIDGHLQMQQDRINELDTKIATVTTTAKGSAILPRSSKDLKDHNVKIAPPLRPLNERRASTFPTSPTTRLQGLGLETARNDSVQGTYSRTSLDHFANDKWHRGALARQFNEQGSPRKITPGKSKVPASPTGTSHSVPETGIVSRRGTLSSLSPPPISQSENSDHEKHNNDLERYTKFEPPDSWVVTRTQGRRLDVKYGGEEAKILWAQFVRDLCTIPPDGRVEMTFQRHILERLDKAQVVLLLETLRDVSTQLEYRRPGDFTKRGSFKVTDYEFDPNFEESVAEYGADIPIGKFKYGRIRKGASKTSIEGTKTAPWKRIM
jgi:hypothetical protein